MYSLKDVQARYENGEHLEFIFFSEHQKTANGIITKNCLSSWYQSSFEMNNMIYQCAEQYIMAEKAKLFDDEESLDKILKAIHPNQMKIIGKEIKNFDEQIWNKNKINIVKIANLAKFSQNTKLKRYLLLTGEKILVKTNSHDTVWGIGLSKKNSLIRDPDNWKGKNLLGFILMDIREIFS